MKNLFLILSVTSILFAACCPNKEPEINECTVLVYVAGDNNLTNRYEFDYLAYDLPQMMEGTKNLATNNKLILFVDHYSSKPYFLQVERGDTLRLKTMSSEMNSGDPETLYEAMKYVTDNFAAKSYGLVLWGHADGWITRGEAASHSPRRAYGVDYINGRTWINTPDMAKVLARLPKLKFIFADCCCFLCVENAYELRNCTDYIIGSAAEIPGEGAPYHTVVPALFSQDADFYKQVVDRYYEQKSHGFDMPLAVVKTSEMENLAQATVTTMASFANDIEPDADGCRYPNVDKLIFYYDHTQFDMQDFMLRYATTDQYAEWKRAFDQAVPYRTFSKVWLANHVYCPYPYTSFPEFLPTEERQGGLGMFLPQTDADARFWYSSKYLPNIGFSMSQLNSKIKEMQWYEAARLADMGW